MQVLQSSINWTYVIDKVINLTETNSSHGSRPKETFEQENFYKFSYLHFIQTVKCAILVFTSNALWKDNHTELLKLILSTH